MLALGLGIALLLVGYALHVAPALGAAAGSDDWPTYMHDSARSGVSEAKLELPLRQQWVHQPTGPPQPAWPDPHVEAVEGIVEPPRVKFDDAYYVAAADGAVYFGSSADGKVYCLDAATGRERWAFFTGGPVRLAPTIYQGRVYVGSDDGNVYCLDGSKGKVIWQFQAAPTDQRVLGAGKMISLWPVRTGVLVEDDVAYFGAGVWPAERVLLCAVNADNGALIWKNDTISDLSTGQHGFTPQGYLLASKTRLFVPSGRSLPACFDRSDGRFLYQRSYGWRGTGLVGGTYALLIGEHLYSGSDQVVTYDLRGGDVGFAWFPGQRLVATGETSYMLDDAGITALDLGAYPAASNKRRALAKRRRDLNAAKPADLEEQLKALAEEEKQNAEELAACTPWRFERPGLDSMIVAGDLVLAGGQDAFVAVDRASGKQVASGAVSGAVKGLAAAEGRLFLSTDQGTIYCFASSTPPAGATAARQPAGPYPRDGRTELYARAAEAIVRNTGITRGYALVLGSRRGRLAYELAKRTDLNVYAVEPDAAKVAAARAALAAAGLYGTRVWVDRGKLDALPYSDYFANLVVSEDALITGELRPSPAEVLRVLKPCGGTLYLGQPSGVAGAEGRITAGELRGWLRSGGAQGFELTRDQGTWAKLVRGPLKGAGSWTHQYGDAGNTASSEDTVVKCPLGVLWYGEPGPGKVPNRHVRSTAPLTINGRVFLQGINRLMCFDAYNGVMYWDREIPGAYRTNMPAECSNLACTEDSLFAATGSQCLRLDAATGETKSTYGLPAAVAGDGHKWAYVAAVGDLLLGSSSTRAQFSDSVFAVNPESGDHAWVHQGQNIRNNTIAVDEGRVFFADDRATPQQRQQALKGKIDELKAREGIDDAAAVEKLASADVRVVVALDLATGEVLWEQPVDLTDCGGNRLAAICQNGVLMFCGSHLNGHYWTQFLSGEYATRRVTALSTKDGSILWSKATGYRIRPMVIGETLYAEPWAFDIHTGEQKMRTHPLTGRQSPWKFERPGHHCGCISGSPNALFFRSYFSAYYDLVSDHGTEHFAGQRPGCWINMIPANGLLIEPEASSGCVCLHSLTATVVMKPRETNKAWGVYCAEGKSTPVKHMAINLGGPGDRRDGRGTLWLAYPRPSGRMRLNFDLGVSLRPDGGYFNRAAEYFSVANTQTPWLYSSGLSGPTTFSVPLVGEGEGPAIYTVRLGFADTDNSRPGQRTFDIKLQDRLVAEDFDIVGAGGAGAAVVREFPGIEVHDNLTIELLPAGAAGNGQGPILNCIEIIRERVLQAGLAAPSFLLSDLERRQTGEVKVANHTGKQFTGTLAISAPGMFRVTPAETPLRLDPGAERTIPVTAAVAQSGRPGEYEVSVRLLREGGAVESAQIAPIEYLGPRGRVTIPAAEDAYVSRGGVTSNYGHGATLLVDGGASEMGDQNHALAFLRFPLDIPGRPVSAVLRLHTSPTDGSQSGNSGRICLVDEPWEEYEVTYAARPKVGIQVGTLGRVDRNEWVVRPLEIDWQGRKALSLVLEPTSTDGANYLSREGGHGPQLVVEYVPR
ncbi:MAG: PQQ-binding-like beta-propeller repeat protein [Armatimonadota bacterium]